MKRRVGRGRANGFIDGDLRHNEPPRWQLPLPPERRASVGFVYCPRSQRIIAPWPRAGATLAEEQRLDAVAERVAAIAGDLCEPCWIWPDERDPVPVEAADIRLWIRLWARDRACYAVSNLAAA